MRYLLANAIALASERHAGQFDKAGMPYILHPLKVMHYLKSDDLELMCIAVLHDIIEDTPTTYKELEDLAFTPRIIDALKLLTRMPGQTSCKYAEGIKSNKDAIKVKLADLRHNSDIRRLKGISDKDTERLRNYNALYMELKDLV
jgi:(p)ppGpp synthase/HD superfamily hydrolase